MRILLLLSTLVFASVLSAQDTPVDSLTRKGKVWLDGTIDDDLVTDQARAGYFFTDRLLMGSGLSIIGSDGVYLSPFVRYYLNGSANRWRPYAEAGLELQVGDFDIGRKYGALGLERTFNATTLLNLELRYTDQTRRGQAYRLRGNFNTLLGGPAGKSAAEGQFRAGSFVLGNQLFEASLSTANAYAFNYLNFTPSIDYFVTDRLALQASVEVIANAFDQSEASGIKDYQALYGQARVGARYYLTTKSLFNLFGEAGLTYSYQSINRELASGDQRMSYDALRADLGIGSSVFINQHTSLDFGVKLVQDFARGENLGIDGFARLKFWF
ncbi:hypothetical protein [Lewinella sp. IMCC34191]|uniref:hypothetical protein n=1 Tax=Lewinella sp. IMCC34191 TaxID=2259172 RepID=UPI000E22EC92|nr:hypothetical protein [Lewinella sp. IMCC34191]